MESVAREAGVSKATLYAYFTSKESLFAHLIGEECRRTKHLVTTPDLSCGIAAGLRSFAKQYTRIFADNDPQRRALFQILVAEAGRFPELGQLMIDSGPRAEAERLAELLESASRQGLLDIGDCAAAAGQFLCLVRGELPIQSALGERRWTQAEIDRTIEGGLHLFLKAYAPATAAARPRAKSSQRSRRAASTPTS
jgi:TetR/AcrR family transcriptional repressor of mexJK operon